MPDGVGMRVQFARAPTGNRVLRGSRGIIASRREVLRDLRRGLPSVLEILKISPTLAKRALEQAQDGRLNIPVDASILDLMRSQVLEQARRGDRVLAGAGLFVGAVLWVGMRAAPGWIAIVLAAGAGLAWLSALLVRPR